MGKAALRILFTGLIPGLAGGLIVWLFMHASGISQFLDRFEDSTYDWRLRRIIDPPPRPIDAITIIAVDSKSLHRMGSFYQWPRTEWARTIDILAESGTRLVGLDVLFDASRFPAEDRALVEAIANHGSVVSSVVMTPADEENFLYPMTRPPEGLQAERFQLDIPADLALTLPAYRRMEPDFVALSNASARIGAVNLSSDQDGVLRRIPLFARFNDQVYPTLALAMAMELLDVQGIRYEEENGTILLETPAETVAVPVDDQGRMLIYYHGPYGTFRYISLTNLLREMYEQRDNTNSLAYFRDKVVLVGASAPGLFDLRAIPRQPSFPGVEVHANVLYQLLQGHFLREMPAGKQFGYFLLLGAAFGLLIGVIAPRPLRGVLLGVSAGIAVFAAAWTLFATDRFALPMVGPLLTLAVTFTGHYMVRYLVEERDKRTIKRTLSHYLPEGVMHQVLQKPELLKLGGDKKTCTVLFSDLAGFTAMSEKMAPEDVVGLLNRYLTAMTHTIRDLEGTLDKYQGDAIMAIFGAPVDLENNALSACRTALAMQRRLAELRDQWTEQGLPAISQRIGISTGPMVIGNMGSDVLFDYTAIGDSVNLGARLESANKLYGTQILISDDTCQAARDHLVVRQVDLLRVYGRQEPVRVYELLALKDDPLDVKTREMLSYFQQGYQHYRDRNWDWAMNQFRQALQIRPDDHPSRLYVMRCQEFLRTPPPESWDGVYTPPGK